MGWPPQGATITIAPLTRCETPATPSNGAGPCLPGRSQPALPHHQHLKPSPVCIARRDLEAADDASEHLLRRREVDRKITDGFVDTGGGQPSAGVSSPVETARRCADQSFDAIPPTLTGLRR